jgi:hypothetical protein
VELRRPVGGAFVRFPVKLVVLSVLFLAACGGGDVCGEDDDGNPFPVCSYGLTSDGPEVAIDYCPGDQWGAIDGCNSCACDADGKILCTSIECPAAEN